MFDKAKRIIAAKICFFVFFSKMIISAIPIYVDVLDKGTVFQILMQLELELTSNGTNTNNEDLHEHNSKVIRPNGNDQAALIPYTESLNKQKTYLYNEKLICQYKAKVPTPPPT